MGNRELVSGVGLIGKGSHGFGYLESPVALIGELNKNGSGDIDRIVKFYKYKPGFWFMIP